MEDPIAQNYHYEFDGLWFKWSDYEIKTCLDSEGNPCKYIVPVGLDLEKYSPVIGDRGTRVGHYKNQQRRQDLVKGQKAVHYKTLIDLYYHLDDENAILDFYREYGPLGLLHHNVHSITKYPRWQEGKPYIDEDGEEWDVMIPLQDRFIKGHNLWIQERLHLINDNGNIEEGILAPYLFDPGPSIGDLCPPNTNSLPQVICKLDPYKPQLDVLPIAKGLSPYFAIVGNRTTFDYPSPHTDMFCRIYSETLEDFRDTISFFFKLHDALSNSEGYTDFEISSAYEYLNSVNDVNILATQMGFHSTSEHFDYDSLLGTFAFSMMDGLTNGYGWDRCKSRIKKENRLCGRVFVKGQSNQQYCCNTCATRERGTRYRENHKK